MEPVTHIFLLIASTVANALSAIAGGGAGLLQFPILLFLGLPFAVALATHKVATIGLGIGATMRHSREGAVRGLFSAYVLLVGLPGVILGALTVLQLPDLLARTMLGVLTIAVGIYSMFRRELGQEANPRNRDHKGLVLGGGLVFLVGVFNGSLSSGSGLFLTLTFVLWFGMDYKAAVAHTMILCGLVMNATGALVLGVLGDVAWVYLPALVTGSIIGGYFGAHISVKNSNKLVKRVFEGVTILVGLRLLIPF